MRWLIVLLFFLLPAFSFAAEGDTLWTRTFGMSKDDRCYDMILTPDSSYFLGGDSVLFPAVFSWKKITSAGALSWEKALDWNCGANLNEVVYGVDTTMDGGYLLVGYSLSCPTIGNLAGTVIKTDASGDSVWGTILGGAGSEELWFADQTVDSQWYCGGYSASFGAAEQFWLCFLDKNGDSLWSKAYGGAALEDAKDGFTTLDSCFILAGYTSSYGNGNNDVWIVKAAANGDSLWSQTYGGAGDEYGYSIVQLSDSGYAIGAFTDSYGNGNFDFWLIRADKNGDSLWSVTYGGAQDDQCFDIRETADGGFLLAGWTKSYGVSDEDFWLVKTDSLGDSLNSWTYGGDSVDVCRALEIDADSNYLMAGWTISEGAGGYDFWLVKIEGDTASASNGNGFGDPDSSVSRWGLPSYNYGVLRWGTSRW